jgi:hypothetical protein
MTLCRSVVSIVSMNLSLLSPLALKAFATIVLAVCLLSQFASSAELDDLAEDTIGEITKKLSVWDNIRLASTSKAMKKAVDAHASPKDVLIGTVNGIIHDSAGSESRAFYVMPFKLSAMTVPDVPVGDFVVVKSPNYQSARDDRVRLSVISNLNEMKGKVLTKATSNVRKELMLNKGYLVLGRKLRMNVYANFRKYGPSAITACINNAYTKVRNECIDGVMVYHDYPVSNERSLSVRNSVPEYDTLYMYRNCAAYSFICGISYMA